MDPLERRCGYSSGNSDPLVTDLSRPEAYPEPQPSSVSLASTHISWVFLTDGEAWKVKRPVNYGFLDFTTLERRRRFCEEEVRLNGRLAPDVYRGVAPVRRDARGFSFAGDGEIVDWAVRMRRLPEGSRALSLLRDGRLVPADLDRLAQRLADFYARATPTPSFGAPETVRANVEENFDQVRPFVGRFLAPDVFEETRAWQEDALTSHEALFRQRVAGGRIREGHGDLRLEHVYFEDDEPRVIDCIEFNERFRCGDVASDAAFLAMDLDHERRPDLADWFLARLALAANDYDLFPLADFYLSYRAWVRGKVACFVAADRSSPAEKRARKALEAGEYFSLSRLYARPRAPQPCLIAVGGLIGTGKTTVAEALGLETGYPVIGSDPTRKHLAGLGPKDRGRERIYAAAFSRKTFAEMFRRAEAVLRSGRGAILDATFRARGLRREADALAGRRGVPFLFVETLCPESVARRRLRTREDLASVSDAREDLFDRFRRDFEPVTELAPEVHVRIDTSGSLAEALQAVRFRLRPGDS